MFFEVKITPEYLDDSKYYSLYLLNAYYDPGSIQKALKALTFSIILITYLRKSALEKIVNYSRLCKLCQNGEHRIQTLV